VLLREGDVRSFLARLPVEVLPVPPLVHQRLRLFGLDSLGQVAALPFSAIQAQFGPSGARAWKLASGEDDSRIIAAPEELRLVEEAELPAPTALSEPLLVGTRNLLQRALERPELRGRSLRRVDWRLGLESGEQVSRKAVFREPTADAARILFSLRGKIERLQLSAAAISLGVTLSGLCSEYGHQANLWQTGPRRWKELVESVEQLNARTGGPQVFRIVEVQPWSRIPERQMGLVAFGA
jgi:DNA polymerase-4/protein ImuB